MSFLERSAWAVVVATVAVYGSFFGWIAMRALSGAPPQTREAIMVLIVATLAYVVLLIASHVAIALLDRSGVAETPDERDRLVEMKAAQPTAFLLGCGVFVLALAAYAHVDMMMLAHGLLALQVAATLLEFGARIRFYRMAI